MWLPLSERIGSFDRRVNADEGVEITDFWEE